MATMKAYPQETKDVMRRYYESRNERNRRRDAGIQTIILGHGGQNYIAKVLGCSRNTVRKGAAEVTGLPMRTGKEMIGRASSDSPKKIHSLAHPIINTDTYKIQIYF